jgi:maleate isomerase
MDNQQADLPWQVAKRARIGVIIPSTNTGVEYDLTKFNLEGVSWHPSRLWIELRNWADESAATGESADNVFERFLDLIRDDIALAVRNALSAKVTYMMMGMSAETFWGGLEGNLACGWHALRACGIADKMTGRGMLLERF